MDSKKDNQVIGIVKATNWWAEKQIKKSFPAILPTDFVVGSWFEFSNGLNVTQEGKTTIANFRKLNHVIVRKFI